MITAPNGVSRLQLAYTFRTAAPRNHYGKSFFEPIRQTDESQLRNPTLKVCVRQLMRQDCRDALALSGKQNRRQDHMAKKKSRQLSRHILFRLQQRRPPARRTLRP
jgi:hypothetical protein